MKVRDICSCPAVTAPPSATLADIAALMRDRRVGAVIVTKATSVRPIPIGVITDRDIVHAQLDRAADLTSLSAEEVMTRDPLVVNETLSPSEVIQLMRARGVRRAPVITMDGALAGVVSTDDLLRELAREMHGIAHLLAHQSRREDSAHT